jgi:hypothetical protein
MLQAYVAALAAVSASAGETARNQATQNLSTAAGALPVRWRNCNRLPLCQEMTATRSGSDDTRHQEVTMAADLTSVAKVVTAATSLVSALTRFV